MNDELAAILALIAAVNPAAAALIAGRPVDRREAVIAGVAAAAVLVVLAALSEPILDALAISPPTFRVAAGIVAIVAGARSMLPGLRRQPPAQRERSEVLYPLTIPALLGPAALMLSVSAGANESAGLAAAGVVGGVALAAIVLLAGPARGMRTAAAFIGALLIAFGVGEIVDGVKSV